MEKYKFRGKAKAFNKWVYGNLVRFRDELYILKEGLFLPVKSIPSEKFIEIIQEQKGNILGLKI